MTDYPYEPPQREFSDTLLAFRDFRDASTMRVRVEPDPLGPVNKIVSLWRGQHRVKAVLTRVPVGATVRCGLDYGSPRVRFFTSAWEQVGRYEGRLASWYVEIGGRRVIDVPEHELIPPRLPTPTPLLREQMRRALREQARAALDAVARRIGYHRDADCTGWDE